MACGPRAFPQSPQSWSGSEEGLLLTRLAGQDIHCLSPGNVTAGRKQVTEKWREGRSPCLSQTGRDPGGTDAPRGVSPQICRSLSSSVCVTRPEPPGETLQGRVCLLQSHGGGQTLSEVTALPGGSSPP